MQPTIKGPMQKTDQPVLERYRIFESSRFDLIRDALVERYGCARSFSGAPRVKNVYAAGSLFRLEDIDLVYFQFPSLVRATFNGAGYFRQQFAITGEGRTRAGGQQFDVNLNSTGVVPSDVEAHCEYTTDHSEIVLRIRETALRRKFAAMTGRAVVRALEFASDGFTNPRQYRLRRLVNFFVNEIDQNDGLSHFACTEFSQLLIVKFLTANRHNLSHLLEERVPDAASYQVRIVEEYIEANWDRPLKIEEIAERTGVGVRTMFATFRKSRGYTPMAFLQRVRLNRARQMLQAPTDDTTVLEVSLKCGFQNTGHFARHYRQAFGELPSITLATARSI